MTDGGVREMTLLEEIENLEIERKDKERIIRKYWDQVNSHRASIEETRAAAVEEAHDLIVENERLRTIVTVLADSIKNVMGMLESKSLN